MFKCVSRSILAWVSSKHALYSVVQDLAMADEDALEEQPGRFSSMERRWPSGDVEEC